MRSHLFLAAVLASTLLAFGADASFESDSLAFTSGVDTNDVLDDPADRCPCYNYCLEKKARAGVMRGLGDTAGEMGFVLDAVRRKERGGDEQTN